MSDATPIPFRQYADFYKCLANEPERFQILSVSSLEVEIRDGAAYVKRFEISGEIVGVNPENLKTYLTKVDEAKHCFEDLRKVGAILAKGKPDRSSP
jgi:indole-3-glycerol phosphate synthase